MEGEILKLHTWSPRFKPASVALLPKSTLSTKIPNPFSDPPSKIKGKGASRDGFVKVINLRLALAAQAIFNSLKCPPIFYKRRTEEVIYNNSLGIPCYPKLSEKTPHSYLPLQIVLKFFQKSSHSRISFKIIEVIVHP